MKLFLLTKFLNRTIDDEFSNNLFIYDLFDSIIDFNAFVIEINRLIREKFVLIDNLQFVTIDWNKFNANQLKIANIIVETIMKNKFEFDQFFFRRFWKNKKIFCLKHCHDQIANNRISKRIDYCFRDNFFKYCDHVFRQRFHCSFSI